MSTYLLDIRTGLLDIDQWYLLARQADLPPETAEAVIRHVQNTSTKGPGAPNSVVDVRRLLFLLKEGIAIEAGISDARWKIQGTDGIRGLVVSTYQSDRQAFIRFTNNNELSPCLCQLYCDAFVSTIEAASDSPVPAIAIGEDGRDHYTSTHIIGALVASLTRRGILVEDLGIVSTPLLALYSRQNHMPGIMVTASHNPAQYNGIKLFLQGRKLYPEGPLGEYEVTWHMVDRIFAASIPTYHRLPSAQINDFIREQIALVAETYRITCDFGRIPLLLDTANGAYSTTGATVFERFGFHVHTFADKPDGTNINAGCGVGVLEEGNGIYQSCDTDLPQTVRELVAFGDSLTASTIYGVVLDGDGDRAFVLIYDKVAASVTVCNGDQMAFLAAHVIADAWKHGDVGNSIATPVFRTTIESDFTLVPLVQETFGWTGETVVVGDRWLPYAAPQNSLVVLGNERSGHLVFPLPVGDGTVYVGNGISSALLVLEALVFRQASIYRPGPMVRNTFRTPVKEALYRDSQLWNTISRQVAATMPGSVREVRFTEEPDMLFYNLYDSADTHVGQWYIRKSGTEPKISMSMSVISDSSLDVERVMRILRQAITPMVNEKE